jgi:MATE family multidrug resistance protein
MLANVLGNYLLIEPRFGLPGYGVAGAAWASTAASWLGFFVILGMFLRHHGTSPRTGALGLKLSEWWRMLRFGLPTGLNWFLEFGAFVLFINVVVARLGTTALAAFNVVMQINSISFMPAFGVGSAGAILVGEAIGRRALDRVWPIVRLTLFTACAWMASAGVLYFLAPGTLIGVFQPAGVATTTLVSVGTSMLILSALWQVFDAISMTFSEALRAAGDTTWPMLARIVTAWLVFTPLAWTAVLVFDGGVTAVMVSVIGYIALLAVVLALRFASGRWRQIELVGTEPELI